MTRDEAKYIILEHKPIVGFPKYVEALNVAIAALEELNEYHAIGTVEGFRQLSLKEHNYDNCHNLTCRTKCEKDGYVKAIDDFAEALKREYPICTNDFGFVINETAHKTIDKIAKRLKEGASDV